MHGSWRTRKLWLSFLYFPSVYSIQQCPYNRVHFCQREDIHGDSDQYKFPDGAGISPEEGAAVLDRSILYLTQVGAAQELIKELEIQRDAALKL